MTSAAAPERTERGRDGIRVEARAERDSSERRLLRKRWSQRIRRVYEVDPLVCPCGATMRIVAVITEQDVIRTILGHLAKVAAKRATEGSGPGPPVRPHPGPAPDPSVN